MCKIVNNMVLDYLSLHLVFRSDTLSYNLRDSDCLLVIPQPCTSYCIRSLCYSGAVLWNSLPLNIRQSPSLSEFKSELKNYNFDSSCVYVLFAFTHGFLVKQVFYHFLYCSSSY